MRKDRKTALELPDKLTSIAAVETPERPSVFEDVHIGKYRVKMRARPDLARLRLGLSQRETEVLHLSVIGYTGPAVAERMGISLRTVETFKRRIFAKTGVKSMAEAAALATAISMGAPLRAA